MRGKSARPPPSNFLVAPSIHAPHYTMALQFVRRAAGLGLRRSVFATRGKSYPSRSPLKPRLISIHRGHTSLHALCKNGELTSASPLSRSIFRRIRRLCPHRRRAGDWPRARGNRGRQPGRVPLQQARLQFPAAHVHIKSRPPPPAASTASTARVGACGCP